MPAVPPLLCKPYSSVQLLIQAASVPRARNTLSAAIPLWKLRPFLACHVQISQPGLLSNGSQRNLPAMQTLRSAPVPLLLILCVCLFRLTLNPALAAALKTHTVTLGPA